MRKLLRANLSRLVRSRLLWLCIAAACLFSLIVMSSISTDGADVPPLDKALPETFPFLALIEAVFVSLFLGAEYQDGTLRNKLIVGHTRLHVYLAALTTSCAGSLLIAGGWALSAAYGVCRFGWFVSPAGTLALSALLCAMITVANAALLTLLALLVTNRAYGAVAAILLTLGLLVLSSSLYGVLCEPELSSNIVSTGDGFEFTEPMPNPAYVSGWRRAVYQFAVDVLPAGQAILLANQELARPVLSLCGSAGIVLLTALAGVACFRRKDLK